MKRLIFGTLAIVMAAAAAAFTTPVKSAGSLTDSYFAFDYANYLPTEANVEDESKWIKVLDMSGCSNIDQAACKVRVTASHVSGNTLLSTADIQADVASSVAYVVGGEIEEFINRANP